MSARNDCSVKALLPISLSLFSNKMAGDIAGLGGSMVEHQPRLLGSRVWFPAGAFAIFFRFCQSFTSNFPLIPFLLSLSTFPSSSFPFPSPFDFWFALKNAFFAFIPRNNSCYCFPFYSRFAWPISQNCQKLVGHCRRSSSQRHCDG